MKRLFPWVLRLLALASGLAAGFAHPPFGLIAGILGYGLLLWTLDLSTSFRSAFLKGWLAGVGYFAVGVWWVVEPFMVDAANQGWMAPFALVLMAGGLSLFWGLAALAYRACRARGVWRVIVFAGCLAGLEWLRGHVLTGFPWDLPGESWRAGSEVSQAAALFGAYGLTWVTVALGAAPALLAYNLPRLKQAMALGVAALTLAGLWGFGAWRLSTAPTPAANAPVVRVVQANIDQKIKWKAENLDSIFHTYLDLTGRPAARTPDVVIWPEGALPAVIDDLMAPGSGFPSWLTATLAENQTLMMGANRAEGSGADARYFNSLVAFRRQGEDLRVTGVYDKHRLVPFGEFMPLGGIAGAIGFRSLVHMPDDFSAGPKPNPIHPDGLPPVQPLICYEALFPGLAQRSEPRPAWMLNISNDAWFGMTSGPLQHLNIASYRAIEQGLPIVRATPTGVSAVIDAQGRILPGKSLPLGGFGVIDAVLPAARPPTPYSQLGDATFLVMLLLSVAAAAGPLLRRTR